MHDNAFHYTGNKDLAVAEISIWVQNFEFHLFLIFRDVKDLASLCIYLSKYIRYLCLNIHFSINEKLFLKNQFIITKKIYIIRRAEFLYEINSPGALF